MKAIAMLPSPTAAATRLTGPERTSPHANIAGHARLEQVRVALQRPLPAGAHRRRSATKPRAVEAISGGSHAVSASAPMKM